MHVCLAAVGGADAAAQHASGGSAGALVASGKGGLRPAAGAKQQERQAGQQGRGAAVGCHYCGRGYSAAGSKKAQLFIRNLQMPCGCPDSRIRASLRSLAVPQVASVTDAAGL